MWKDVTVHIWIWISTFKGTGNRLPKHCNRLPESKNSLVNMFWEKSCATQFLRKLFILILIKPSLDSWILILILEAWSLNLDSWFLKSTFLLNLEGFLILSWTHSLIDLRAFCHHLCYHQNIFESLLFHHEALLLQNLASIASLIGDNSKESC